jgi:hypothetical protein
MLERKFLLSLRIIIHDLKVFLKHQHRISTSQLPNLWKMCLFYRSICLNCNKLGSYFIDCHIKTLILNIALSVLKKRVLNLIIFHTAIQYGKMLKTSYLMIFSIIFFRVDSWVFHFAKFFHKIFHSTFWVFILHFLSFPFLQILLVWMDRKSNIRKILNFFHFMKKLFQFRFAL